MRASRHYIQSFDLPRAPHPRPRSRTQLLIAILLLIALSLLLPSGSYASREPTGDGSGGQAPLVKGADYTVGSFQYNGGLETTEKSFKGDLTIPAGKREATFTSEATRSPMDFSDLAPHWWADGTDATTVLVEIRTGSDGKSWTDWQVADAEDEISDSDPL